MFAGWARWDIGWVADEGGVRGFATVEYEPWHGRLILWFLYIAPEWRRRGVGRALLDRVEAYGREVGATHVWLETSNVNVPGIAAYERLRAVRRGSAVLPRTCRARPRSISRRCCEQLRVTDHRGVDVLRIAMWILGLVGCGSTAPAGPLAQPQVASVSTERAERMERERRSELASAHRELEVEQQTAFAATCEATAGTPPPPRCEPSCYRAEPPDPRAGKKLGRAEIVHVVCRRAENGDTGPLVFVEEMGKPNDSLRAGRGRMPKPHKKGTWEAEIEAAVGAALAPEVKRGDVIRVAGTWRTVSHPVTAERLRCVPVTHHVASMRRALDACGGRGALACEAMGNAAVHGLNVVRYRLAEARQLQAAGKLAGCQRASLEAIAVARGLPRWRQYVSLNVDQWKTYPRYRTRFDGILDEDTLFTTAIALGAEAQQIHVDCGGPTTPKTTAAQEQSFHTCW